MRQANVKLIIDAPIERVWSVLTDVEKYADWNPFVYEVKADNSEPIVDTKMVFRVRFDHGKETKSKELVLEYDPPQKLGGESAYWVYRFAGFFHSIGMIRAIRCQTLKSLPSGKTVYSSEETFTGWGKSFVPLDSVQNGFERQGEALKKRCEKG